MKNLKCLLVLLLVGTIFFAAPLTSYAKTTTSSPSTSDRNGSKTRPAPQALGSSSHEFRLCYGVTITAGTGSHEGEICAESTDHDWWRWLVTEHYYEHSYEITIRGKDSNSASGGIVIEDNVGEVNLRFKAGLNAYKSGTWGYERPIIKIGSGNNVTLVFEEDVELEQHRQTTISSKSPLCIKSAAGISGELRLGACDDGIYSNDTVRVENITLIGDPEDGGIGGTLIDAKNIEIYNSTVTSETDTEKYVHANSATLHATESVTINGSSVSNKNGDYGIRTNGKLSVNDIINADGSRIKSHLDLHGAVTAVDVPFENVTLPLDSYECFIDKYGSDENVKVDWADLGKQNEYTGNIRLREVKHLICKPTVS